MYPTESRLIRDLRASGEPYYYACIAALISTVFLELVTDTHFSHYSTKCRLFCSVIVGFGMK